MPRLHISHAQPPSLYATPIPTLAAGCKAAIRFETDCGYRLEHRGQYFSSLGTAVSAGIGLDTVDECARPLATHSHKKDS